jgi:hypothetical protein
VLGAGIGAVCADAIVKYEAKTAIELEQQIEDSKKANRRRFQGEDCSLIMHVCLHPDSQKPFLLKFRSRSFSELYLRGGKHVVRATCGVLTC